MTEDSSRDVVVKQVIASPRSQVWQALTDPEILKEWYSPPGWSLDTASAEIALAVGGAYRVSMRKDSDPQVATSVVARFFDVVPEVRLASRETVFGASGLAPVEMVLTIELSDAPEGTLVSIHQGPFPYGVDALGRSGWLNALSRLRKLLAHD